MNFKAKYDTSNKSVGTNTCRYIILHHTATAENSVKWVVNRFITKWSPVSCHFVIDVNWDKYKIWNPENILRHCWVSNWKWLSNMNKYSIWIEVIWPLSYWFDDRQRRSVKELIIHLMKVYWIKKENVLRHKDIAPWRKTDIADSFWNNEFKSFNDWKDAKLVL